jgi:glutamate/tyrosine decarboxylase-like PLP-dependent enzyme
MGKVMGIENPAGYVTSGGTEGNMACLWWCRLYLSKVSAEIRYRLEK